MIIINVSFEREFKSSSVHLGGGITVCAILIKSYRPVPMSRITNTRTSVVSWSVIDVSSVCEFMGSSRALGGCNNSVRRTHDVLQAHVNFKNNKYPEVYLEAPV